MGAARTDRRRRRAVPWAVLGLWVAALLLVGPFAGKFGDVQQNRAVDYLPDSADSTRVARIQDELPGGQATDLVLVYHRDGGLTAADRARAAGQIAEIRRTYPLTGSPAAVPSRDGTTLMYAVSSTQPGQDDDKRDAFVEALRAGASGFLVKDTRPAELLDAIRTVAAGESLLSPGPTARLIARFLRTPSVPVAGGPECLSEREREVLILVARGLNNTEVGEALGLSPLTAKTHVSRIMGKLGARDRAQLVVVAYESGLVTPGTV
ncbi:LuxR C-terminal-related transcriptional regulator [Streptomyces sp. Ru62]|uniref:response regulator transcription factor n=1 Tax=Streptomyces sp. Ru62 TaxID=2080745 RepID=UPI0021560B94|nr:LuxR C-terminal-related transcriptional regulator [Streptomyces sp. Ru62]